MNMLGSGNTAIHFYHSLEISHSLVISLYLVNFINHGTVWAPSALGVARLPARGGHPLGCLSGGVAVSLGGVVRVSLWVFSLQALSPSQNAHFPLMFSRGCTPCSQIPSRGSKLSFDGVFWRFYVIALVLSFPCSLGLFGTLWTVARFLHYIGLPRHHSYFPHLMGKRWLQWLPVSGNI